MADVVATRLALQRVAVHVLARARHQATGRFGLRVTPGGIGTPAFGDEVESVRIAGTALVREAGGEARYLALAGASLHDAAAFAGVDLTEFFSAGDDTPPLGDPAAPLAIDSAAAVLLHTWWAFGWQVLDVACARTADAKALQLWPEHFDVGTSVRVGAGGGDRCNLGVSPGDSFSDEPYLYVGPWSDARPGGDGYWNASFGAVLKRSELRGEGGEALDGNAAVDFVRRGLDRLAGATS